MIRTLLFGAGPGAGFFIENNLHERDFVGILDNDKSKLGKRIFDLTVFSPSSVSEIEFDEIVVTTQWAMPVKAQLIEEFGVSESKVVIPVKNQLKSELPFYNNKSIQLARQIITDLNQLALENKIPLVIDFGTLLGVVRDQDIIAWDDDVDFAAPQEYAGEVERLVRQFVEANPQIDWRIERVVDANQLATSILLKFSDSKKEIISFTTSISFRRAQDGKSIHLPSLGMWYAPEHHFQGIETLDWHGSKMQVPLKHEDYLTFQYGDWRTPKKDIKLTDYANLQEVGFEEFKSEKRILHDITGSQG